MAKKIFSGLFVLTAVGALGIIVAGAVSDGDQLFVRFLTAVVVAALGLYVVSDLRLQSNRAAADEEIGELEIEGQESIVDLEKLEASESGSVKAKAEMVKSGSQYESVGFVNSSQNPIGYDLSELEDLRDSLNTYEPTGNQTAADVEPDSADDLVALVGKTPASNDQFAWPVSGEMPAVDLEKTPEELGKANTSKPKDRIVRQELVDSLEIAIDEFTEDSKSRETPESLKLIKDNGEAELDAPAEDELTRVGIDLSELTPQAISAAAPISQQEDTVEALGVEASVDELTEEPTVENTDEASVERVDEPESLEHDPDRVETETTVVPEAQQTEDDLTQLIDDALVESDVAESNNVEPDVADSETSDIATAESIDELQDTVQDNNAVIDLVEHVDNNEKTSVIDLRESEVVSFKSGIDEAIALGETTVVDTLIEQGMLSTEGEITDRDVRTMVYVAFTSNELKKLIKAGGMPGSDQSELDLGPVELFDESEFSPAPKLLYKADEQ